MTPPAMAAPEGAEVVLLEISPNIDPSEVITMGLQLQSTRVLLVVRGGGRAPTATAFTEKHKLPVQKLRRSYDDTSCRI